MNIDASFMEAYTPIIRAIACKATPTEDLRADLVQEVYLALLMVEEASILTNRDAFIRAVALNTIYNIVQSYTKGDWYRAKSKRERGTTGKTNVPPRYIRIGDLVDRERLQIDTAGNLHPGEYARVDNFSYQRELEYGGRQVLFYSCLTP